jgi:Co/Zn/Cd efflux system component
MRNAINNNPMVQIGVIGVLVVVVGLFMMMNLSKKSSSHPASSASATPGASSSSPTGGTSVPLTPEGSAPPTSSGSTGVTPPATSGTVTPSALIPGPGLPAPVIKAWKGGDAVVLLLVRGGGIDDRLVRGSVHSLSSDRGIAVFVARAKDIARYSRITQGVGVDSLPALVEVRPRRDTGTTPEAQVSYGFRNSQSVVQAVHDAVYNGRDDLPYSPR